MMSRYTLGFPCFGGKTALMAVLKIIIEYLSRTYNLNIMADLCGGGGKVAFGVNPYNFKEVIYNELETGMANMIACLKDEKITNHLIVLIEELVSEASNPKELFKVANSLRNKKETDIILSAAYTVICVYGSFCNDRKGFNLKNFDKRLIFKKVHYSLHKYNNTVRNIRVMNENCFDLLEKYGHCEDVLAFLDVPYVPSAMKSKKHYEHSWTEENHKSLVKLLLSNEMNMKWVVCGYDNVIYGELEKSGKCRRYYVGTVTKSSGASKGSVETVKEYIWTNMPIPSELLPEEKDDVEGESDISHEDFEDSEE
jgi:site-specific DNA-adenine methylase